MCLPLISGHLTLFQSDKWYSKQMWEGEWRYFEVVLWIVHGSWKMLHGGKHLHEEAMDIKLGGWIIKKDLELLMVENGPCIIEKGKLELFI